MLHTRRGRCRIRVLRVVLLGRVAGRRVARTPGVGVVIVRTGWRGGNLQRLTRRAGRCPRALLLSLRLGLGVGVARSQGVDELVGAHGWAASESLLGRANTGTSLLLSSLAKGPHR